MESANDPIESFFNSIQAVKGALLPLELGIKKAAKDIECCWPGPQKRAWGTVLSSPSHGGDKRNKFMIGVFKRQNAQCMVGEQKRKGLPVKAALNSNMTINFEPLECFVHFVFDQIGQNLQKLGHEVWNNNEKEGRNCSPAPDDHVAWIDHLKLLTNILEGQRADMKGFFRNLRFARVGGVPPSMVDVISSVKEEEVDGAGASNGEEAVAGNSVKTLASGVLNIPISNVERLRSASSMVSLMELIELAQQLPQPPKDYPDKKKLLSVQDFFKYTESEGRRFFEELDRDGDGEVTLEDLEIAMNKRKLPKRYAREFMRHARSHLSLKSFGWKQFLSFMEQREPTILKTYTSLCLSKSGTLQKSEILTSLKNAGLPANEENAVSMMRFLNADREGSISYGHFRNFMLLLPSDRLQDDSRDAGGVLTSALAGGLSCAFSTFLMHPIDTIKTQVQASTLSFPEIIAKIPEIGIRGVYRGSIPAIIGQFSGHALRTGICEASKLMLINVAPALPDFQVQSVASFCSAVLGTVSRVPSEVVKQRLQAGLFDNLGEAIVGTWQQDGLKTFFRGTGATLCREVPFYVAGMGLYEESKKLVQHLLGRELEPWESMFVGAASGGLAAVTTTPFDVMKTRMMTAAHGQPVSMSKVGLLILRQEGPLGLFRGAVPHFFWVAPLGAINFAGYELTKKFLDKCYKAAVKGTATDQLHPKKVVNSSSKLK